MKAIKEVLLRTFSIIKTHLTLFSNYRNYSETIQYKGFKGLLNRDYDDILPKFIINTLFGQLDTETDTFKGLSLIEKTGSFSEKKIHMMIKTDRSRFYVKILNNITLTDMIRESLRSSRAKKFFICNFEIASRGIRTAPAVFCLEKKSLFLKKHSIIMTRSIDNSLPFREFFRQEDKFRKELLEELVNFIYKLNSFNIAHGDLLGNLLVTKENGSIYLTLIDNDAIKLIGNITRFDKIKHFEGFYDFFVKKEKFSEESWEELCRLYLSLDKGFARSSSDLTEMVKNRKNLFLSVKTALRKDIN